MTMLRANAPARDRGTPRTQTRDKKMLLLALKGLSYDMFEDKDCTFVGVLEQFLFAQLGVVVVVGAIGAVARGC